MSSTANDIEDAEATKKKCRTPYDIQRSKLEKLMKDPSKPAFIPEPRKERDPNKAPDFVYNVMGSSAGAGSGEFHIYRNIRRKETFRQKVLAEQADKKELNEAYHQKLADNERLAEEKTAKKRAKRLKKKKNKKMKKGQAKKEESSSEEEEEEEEEGEREEKETEAEKEEKEAEKAEEETGEDAKKD